MGDFVPVGQADPAWGRTASTRSDVAVLPHDAGAGSSDLREDRRARAVADAILFRLNAHSAIEHLLRNTSHE